MKWNEMTWYDMKWNDMKWMNEYTSKCIDECANKSVNTNIIFSSLARRWVPCLQQHGRGSSETEQLLLRSARYFLTSKSPDLKKQWGPGWVVRSQQKKTLRFANVSQRIANRTSCSAGSMWSHGQSPTWVMWVCPKKGGESDQGNIANLKGNMRFLNRQTHIVGYYSVGVRILLKECFYD
jgi:hypothetical protein